MNFFEPPSDLPDFKPPPRPAWAGPPDSELGVRLPTRSILARSDDVVIALTDCVVYSNGFEIAIGVVSRTPKEPQTMGFRPPTDSGVLPEWLLRVGVAFSDGRKATSMGFHSARWREHMRAAAEGRTPPEPEGPLMFPRGGGGGGTRWDHRYWIWPLPPPGVLKIACEWPAEGIPLTFYELNGDEIHQAAQESVSFWTSPPS